MNLGFIFTNYNNSDVTIEAIKSILLIKNTRSLKIIVVDNNSSISERNKLINEYDNNYLVHLIFNKNNLGYFNGLNCGIELIKEIEFLFDFLIIGNNDLIFSPNFTNKLEEVKALISDFPVISPNIITKDGQHQNPHVISKISWLREIAYDIYHYNFFLSRIIIKISSITKLFTDRKDEDYYKIPQFIYQGYGACYILTPLFLKVFDKLWSPTFLLGEEFFLSKQLSEKNYKIFYEPSVELLHNCHVSTSKVPSRVMWHYSVLSHKIYRKYVKIKFKNNNE
jgi:GT2 family glycosyltransferase